MYEILDGTDMKFWYVFLLNIYISACVYIINILRFIYIYP